MRLIATFTSQDEAKLFGDVLLVKGMHNDVEPGEGEAWVVWVHDENRLNEANAELKAFRASPGDAALDKVAEEAERLRKLEEEENLAAAKLMKGRNDLFKSSMGYLTLFLVVLSVGVTLLTNMSLKGALANTLTIASMEEVGGNMVQWHGLNDIKQGQVWRLITPIFLHLGWLHIIFNMLWLRDLGGMIERTQGTWKLGLLVLVLAILPNVAQYYSSGPGFGGMSGVVYGLLGYIWMMGRFDPECGLYLHPTTVNMMMIWFLICLTGIMPVANTVHAVGLGLGVVWGYLGARLRRA